MGIEHLHFYLLDFIVFLLLISLLNTHAAEAQDSKAPTSDGGKVLEGTPDTDLCKSDDELANVCSACAALPPMMSLPMELCCSDDDAVTVCSECLSDPESCFLAVVALQESAAGAMESDTDQDGASLSGDTSSQTVDSPSPYGEAGPEDDGALLAAEKNKRYGTLFLGKRPVRFLLPDTVPPSDVMKRDDTSDATDPDDDSEALDKRWGTLGLGSRNYGRYARLYWTPANQRLASARNNGKRWGTQGVEKRWGSLGLGNGMRWSSPGADKRWGSLGIGRGKRWGSLGIGKRWGTLGIGKRWGSLGIGDWKRWGSLGLGKWYRPGTSKRWGTLSIGKRTNPSPDRNQPDTTAEEKRWGSLGLSNRFQWGPSPRGKRWGSLGLSSWRKRWGQLVLGRGKRWGTLGIGKRNEVLTALDDNANYLDSLAESPDDDAKRSGGLTPDNGGEAATFAGDEDGSVPEDKRWGTLGIGKRWGNLGGFGGFKRWGYIDLRHGSPFSDRRRKLGKRSVDEAELSETGSLANQEGLSREDEGVHVDEMADAAEKRWGSLGIGKKWGSLGIGKKWGSLGIGKKWGSLGIGKKWGSLGIGRKWDSSDFGKKLGSPEVGRTSQPSQPAATKADKKQPQTN